MASEEALQIGKDVVLFQEPDLVRICGMQIAVQRVEQDEPGMIGTESSFEAGYAGHVDFSHTWAMLVQSRHSVSEGAP